MIQPSTFWERLLVYGTAPAWIAALFLACIMFIVLGLIYNVLVAPIWWVCTGKYYDPFFGRSLDLNDPP